MHARTVTTGDLRTGLARKYKVQIRPGWAEPLNLFHYCACLRYLASWAKGAGLFGWRPTRDDDASSCSLLPGGGVPA